MLDQEDEGTRIGVWVALGVVFMLLAGLIFGVLYRATHQTKQHRVAAPAAVSAAAVAPSAALALAPPAAPIVDQAASATVAAAAAVVSTVENLLDGPLRGERLAKLYFDSGSHRLPADASRTLELAVRTLAANPSSTLVLSGFHDATGDPAKNAELAKNRAVAVRDALVAAGADANRVALRKPAVVEGGADAQEARRVEMRMVK